METSSGNPYQDKFLNADNSVWIRKFFTETADEELIWHRDKYDREISVLEGEGWELQLDNELPTELVKGQIYKIPAMEYHRLIKGKTNLVLKIWEER